MTLDDMKALPILQTRGIAEAAKGSPETHNYIVDCLMRFFRGDYGDIGQEDTDFNNQDLKEGEGHVLAKYGPMHGLTGDIYIESHFSESVPGMDSNHTMIMYCDER